MAMPIHDWTGVNDRQYIVVATGARGIPAELVALVLP